MVMGKQRVNDHPKTMSPLTTTTNLTPLTATAGRSAGSLGYLPIGNYKGAAAFFDLDKLANQPLVWAEQLHIIGNLDGATVGVDLAAITVPAGATAGTVVSGASLAVPTGLVYFINAILLTCAADATGTIVGNWRCTLFPDALGSALGGVYHTAWLATPLAPPASGQDEFSAIATLFAIGNKPVPLRLPGGESITGQLMNAAGAANATGVAGTIQLFGWVGRTLVA